MPGLDQDWQYDVGIPAYLIAAQGLTGWTHTQNITGVLNPATALPMLSVFAEKIGDGFKNAQNGLVEMIGTYIPKVIQATTVLTTAYEAIRQIQPIGHAIDPWLTEHVTRYVGMDAAHMFNTMLPTQGKEVAIDIAWTLPMLYVATKAFVYQLKKD